MMTTPAVIQLETTGRLVPDGSSVGAVTMSDSCFTQKVSKSLRNVTLKQSNK